MANKSGIKLKWGKETYSPKRLAQLSIKELKKEYSRLRKASIQRATRLLKAGLEYLPPYKELSSFHVLKDLTDDVIPYELARLARTLQKENQTVKTAREFYNESYYKEFAERLGLLDLWNDALKSGDKERLKKMIASFDDIKEMGSSLRYDSFAMVDMVRNVILRQGTINDMRKILETMIEYDKTDPKYRKDMDALILIDDDGKVTDAYKRLKKTANMDIKK